MGLFRSVAAICKKRVDFPVCCLSQAGSLAAPLVKADRVFGAVENQSLMCFLHSCHAFPKRPP